MILTESEIERLVLEEAAEDRKGLWEIHWALPVKFPDGAPDPDLCKAVEQVMRKMVHKGLIRLERNQWGKNGFLPVSPNKSDALLADPVHWNVPPSDGYWAVWCVATEAGNRAWRQKAAQALEKEQR